MRGFDAQITFCSTQDLIATAGFYEGIMGFPLALDQGTCRIYRVARDAYLGFCRRADAVRPDGAILTLVTDDVDGWHRRLIAKGVPCEKAPAFNPTYKIYQAFFRDPNGYLIEIQRFEDPLWNPEVAS
jgi:catechol 2,3-dioxygenase-like lactoylglutathione lyase family enzyme